MLDETAEAAERTREKQVLDENKARMVVVIVVVFFFIAVGWMTRPPRFQDEPISNNATYRNPVTW